ncbi:hypothetical protein D9M71_721770 [compost metagenome]
MQHDLHAQRPQGLGLGNCPIAPGGDQPIGPGGDMEGCLFACGSERRSQRRETQRADLHPLAGREDCHLPCREGEVGRQLEALFYRRIERSAQIGCIERQYVAVVQTQQDIAGFAGTILQ